MVFGSDATERKSDGTTLTFTPSRVIPLDGGRAALISTAQGTDCHACAGVLRVDYLNLMGRDFTKPFPAISGEFAGGSWGAPPTFKVFLKPGVLPVIKTQGIFAGQGCVVTMTTMLKLAQSGPVKIDEKSRNECAQETGDNTTTANVSAN